MDGSDRFRYRLEYLVALGLLRGLSRLPAACGRALGRAAGSLLSSRSRLAAENMRNAFPRASPAEIDAWVRGCWENLGQALSEFSRAPGMSREEYFRLVDVEGGERLEESRRKGKGVVLFTAHYANWELIPHFLMFMGLPVAMVARRMKNPYVNDFVTRARASTGAQVFMHKNAVRESIRWLRRGGVLGLLFDQRITDGGVTVPFLGRPAFTTTLPALLALRLGSPVHPIHCRREGDRVRIRVEPAMDFSRYRAREEDILKATADMTAVVERWVRESPPQWLWIHNRWKL